MPRDAIVSTGREGNNVTIVQVRYVLEVARCLNISHAAKHLFVTQSALSQQIARLESELGYLLFQREVHGLRLTKEGEAFCRAAEPVLEGWTEFSQYALRLRPPQPPHRDRPAGVLQPAVWRYRAVL